MFSSISQFLTKEQYNIGFIQHPGSIDFDTKISITPIVNWINTSGYKGGWFADPFILDADTEKIEVLVEEWVDSQNKGRLSKLIIDRNENKLLGVKPIIESEKHFSFPNIWRENNVIYVYPENYQSGGLYLYEYDRENNTLTRRHCLLREPVLDAQLVIIDNAYYLFCIKQTDGKFQNNKLYIYKSDSLLGKFIFFQEIYNKKKEERGAGEIFRVGDKIIRPAQCCEGDYGVALIFYELCLNNGIISEIEVGRMYPNKKQRFNRKIHTYNRYRNIIVVDGNEFKHRCIAAIYKKFIKPIFK